MIVFLHVPKTAGSTFQFILENSFGISACHTNHIKAEVFEQGDFEFARRFFFRLKSIAGHNLVDPLSLRVGSPFYITFLREPIARVISQYRDSVHMEGNRLSFEECVRTLPRFQDCHVRLMAGGRDLDRAKLFLEKCHVVGLTEHFDLSLEILRRLCPERLNLNYATRRVTPRHATRINLDAEPRLMDIAREYNELDLELYRFATEEVFPALCERAGLKGSDEAPTRAVYANEWHPQFLLCQFFNMLVYRQAAKLKRAARTAAGSRVVARTVKPADFAVK
jgi:hypothetical protein